MTVRAELEADGRIHLEAPLALKEAIREVPGTAWKPATGWTLPLSWAACQALRGQFGAALEVGPALVAWATQELQVRVAPNLAIRELLELPDLGPDREEPALFPYQQVAVEFALRAGQALVANEPGTGKTPTAIRWLRHLPAGEALPALVVAPNSMVRTWLRELARWAPELRTVGLSGSAAKRRASIAAARAGSADVLVTNWEGLRGFSRLAGTSGLRLVRCEACGGDPAVAERQCETHDRELNGGWIRAVVADEAHRGKDPKAKWTRALWAVGDAATYRLALTGTPVVNVPQDLWALMRFVSPAEFPSRNKFIERYCVRSWNPWGGLEVLGLRPERREELFRILYPRYLRQLKARVLPQLPPKLYETREVELVTKQRRAYDQLREEMLAELDGGVLAATSPLVLAGRLCQLAAACGTVGEDGELRLCEPSAKLDELMDLLAGDLAGQQVPVFAESRQLLELLEVRLTKAGIPHASVTGAVTGEARDAALDRFASGEARVLLLTSGAGGEGLTLTNASTLVRLQRSWSPARNTQVEDRVHRVTQLAEKVLIIDLVAVDTVEEGQLEALRRKGELQEEVTLDRETLRRLLG